MRSNEADVREGIDAEESEALLRLFELNVAEEVIWVARARVRVVGDEGLGEKKEFGIEGFELELRLVVELGGVEEDKEVVGSWGFFGAEVEILSFFYVFVSEDKFWIFCVFNSKLMYFYVLNFVFMFF